MITCESSNAKTMDISSLPKDCIEQILSRTTPIDVLRSSVVSKHFYSASESDVVWENFFPLDYHEIVSHSSSPIPHFASKKQLFFYLCHTPAFLHNDTQSFALDKRSGKKCYTLGAKALTIIWGNGETPWYWDFTSIPDSRFPEVAQLTVVFWLEIKGRIHVKQLSPHTTYGAYIVFKLQSTSMYGFEDTPVKVAVLEVDEEDAGPPRNSNHIMESNRSFYLQTVSRRENLERQRRYPGESPIDRGDGWMEVELGRYHVGDIDRVSERAVVDMTLWEVSGSSKSGLLVDGIDLRPLD